MPSNSRAIGIDLGTTYSCVAIMDGGKPRVVQSRLGYSTLPSIVALDDAGNTIVGQAAERRMTLHASETIYGSKRLLGRTFLAGVRKQFQPHFRYKLVADEEGFVAAELAGKTMRLVDASAAILKELRRSAEDSLGEKLDRAVITVPAYFNENQRALVREAGRLAGLDVLRIINEPTAAALSFGCHPTQESKLLVFDLGGGTFDISIIRAKSDVYEVVGVDGNSFLGGIDFDRKLMDWLILRLRESHPEKRFDAVGRERLRKAAQDAKHVLSGVPKTEVRIPSFQFEDGTVIDVHEVVTREKFEELTAELVATTFEVLERALSTAGFTTRDIDEVLLVGGQTRMPAIHRRLAEMFGKEPSKRLHPDEVVALGAAIAAYSHDHEDAPVLRDVLPLSIGIAARGGRFVRVVPKNAQVPCKVTLAIRIPAGAKSMTLALYQGERSKVAKNQYLGTLRLQGWEAQKTDARCKVVFELNNECLLQVRAVAPELGLNRAVVLQTKQAAVDVMMGAGTEDVQVGESAPLASGSGAHPSSKSSGTLPASSAKPSSEAKPRRAPITLSRAPAPPMPRRATPAAGTASAGTTATGAAAAARSSASSGKLSAVRASNGDADPSGGAESRAAMSTLVPPISEATPTPPARSGLWSKLTSWFGAGSRAQ